MMTRHRAREIIDDPTLPAARLWPALSGLQRINFWSGSAGIVWGPIRALARSEPDRVWKVLDIATGGGDVPIRLFRKARRAGLRLELAGADQSPAALDFARRRAAEQGADVRFFALDALASALPDDYDVVMCSLFLHHLEDDQAVELLRRMGAAARRLVLVNDLRRSRLGWCVAWAGTRVLTRSAMVHTDGPQSVAAAFTPAEVAVMAERAGLPGATVRRCWPWRLRLAWPRPT